MLPHGIFGITEVDHASRVAVRQSERTVARDELRSVILLISYGRFTRLITIAMVTISLALFLSSSLTQANRVARICAYLVVILILTDIFVPTWLQIFFDSEKYRQWQSNNKLVSRLTQFALRLFLFYLYPAAILAHSTLDRDRSSVTSYWAIMTFFGAQMLLSIFGDILDELRSAKLLSSKSVTAVSYTVILIPAIPILSVPMHYLLSLTGKQWKGTIEGLFLYAVYTASTVLFDILLVNILKIISAHNKTRNPKAYLLHELTQALNHVKHLNRFGRGLRYSEECSLILNHIEMAAEALEKLPKRNIPGDEFVANWYIEYCERRANAIRELKKWVLLPKGDTGIHLEEEIRNRVALVAKDDWDGLPEFIRDPPPKLTWSVRILQALRSTLSGVIPVAIIFAFGNQIQWPSVEIRIYTTFFACAWALFTFLPLLDSGFKERLSMLKELPKLPFGESAKKEE